MLNSNLFSDLIYHVWFGSYFNCTELQNAKFKESYYTYPKIYKKKLVIDQFLDAQQNEIRKHLTFDRQSSFEISCTLRKIKLMS